MIAFAGSVLLHGLLLGALAFLPDAVALNPPAAFPEDAEPATLEIVLETPPPPEPEAEPEPEPAAVALAREPPPALPVTRSTPAPVASAPALQPLRTTLDPVNLKKSDVAPEKPAFVAAHHSLPGRKAEAEPTPVPAAAEDGAGTAAVQSAPAIPEAGEEGDDEGEGGIAAIGEWKKAVGNSIGQGWNRYREAAAEKLAVGTVRLRFTIDAEGTPSDIRILANSADKANADYAVRAVREADIPPVPAERLARVSGGRIHIEYSFTIYPTP